MFLSTSLVLAFGGSNMANLHCDVSLSTIVLYNYAEKTHFPLWREEKLDQVQAILKEFGITFPSKWDVIFEGEAYKLRALPQHFGAQDVEVLYRDYVIAKAEVVGSNYCDREGILTIYLDTLSTIYDSQ